MRFLLVDDHRSARRVLAEILSKLPDTEVFEAEDVPGAERLIAEQQLDVALIDLRLSAKLGDRDGLHLVRSLRERTAVTPIVVTSARDMSDIRAAMQSGAYDYILKEDVCDDLVLPVIRRLAERNALHAEVISVRSQRGGDVPLSEMIGRSLSVERLRVAIRRVATSRHTVLVTGPTGAGKELVVHAVHRLGPSPAEPVFDINCGAIPETLMESQLFGHERGAFSGADHAQPGAFGATRSGTLFLDEVAELPLPLQTKLLRVVETGTYRAIGSQTDRRFNGRIVAATHVDLETRVQEGRFREDLFHRLNVLHLRVPSLEERRDDIPDLVAHFARQGERRLTFSQDAVGFLCKLSWPGNIRQLRNLIARAQVFAKDDQVDEAALRELISPAQAGADSLAKLSRIAAEVLRLPVDDKLNQMEAALIRQAMHLASDNKSEAARLLGVHRKVIERRLNADDSST